MAPPPFLAIGEMMSNTLNLERLDNGWVIERDNKRSIHTSANSALEAVAEFLIPGLPAEDMFKEILESKKETK